jgi:hypothetical protein
VIDPLSVFGALKTVADAGDLAGVLREWVAGDELDRLLHHLDSVFGETTGLSAAQLETWEDDDAFCAALFAVSYTADWATYRSDLRDEVLRLTAENAGNPREAELQLANEVVGEIETYLPHAKRGDEVTRYTSRETKLAIERSSARLLSRDWAPERGQELFDQLAETSETEAAHLQLALKDKDHRIEIPGLLSMPPSWLQDGSGLLWEVLAASAEGAGLWQAALEAWGQAFDRAGSDRVRTRVRAATAAHIAGGPARGRELFADAELLDPSHPLVLFTRAQQSDDPKLTLELLDSIEPKKDSQRKLRNARRAVPLAELGRWKEADDALEQARLDEIADLELREIQADVALARGKSAWRAAQKPDMAALLAAADLYLELRDKHRELDAHEGSVAYLSRAVDALLTADERRRAIELMGVEKLTEEELATPINRSILGEQLLRAGRPDLAAEMLPELDVEDETSSLLHAIVRVQAAAEDEELVDTISLLDDAIANGDQKLPAAHARVLASLRGIAEWSEPALAVISGEDKGLGAVLQARWLARGKRWDEAERVLMPHFEEPRTQHALLDIALERDESDRISARAREILNQPSDHAVRLEAARALIRIEHLKDAEVELERITSAEDVPRHVRAEAFPELAELLSDAQRYRELLILVDSWLELEPDAHSAIWGRAHCLFRLGRFEEALRQLDDRGLEPVTLGQAGLAARLYGLILTGEEAVRRIIAIADSLETPDESIEALALFSVLNSPAQLPGELVERVNAKRFTELFPDSTLIHRFDAPETLEELVGLLEDLGGDRQARITSAAKSVFDVPGTPAALISLAAGQTVGETWRSLNRRPTSFGVSSLADDERANASNAFTVGAVWDSSALYLVEALGEGLAEALRSQLPKSVIPQSVLDDALADSESLRPAGERGTVGLDDEGRPFMASWTEELVEEEKTLAEQVRNLARDLQIEPDRSADDDGIEAQAIEELDPQPQFLTYLGTLSVARRLLLPVFSGDRSVRLSARRSGLRAFGIESAIDGLADRGDITSEERSAYRRRLRSLGASGTQPSSEELVSDARDSRFCLNAAAGFAIQDPASFRSDAGQWHYTLLEFLRGIHKEAPDTFDRWTARVIDALHMNHSRLSHSQHAGRLLALSWQPVGENEFTKALALSVVAAVSYFGDRGDPVLAAARLLYRATAEGLNWVTRGALVARFADLMPPGYSFRARLVIFEEP